MKILKIASKKLNQHLFCDSDHSEGSFCWSVIVCFIVSASLCLCLFAFCSAQLPLLCCSVAALLMYSLCVCVSVCIVCIICCSPAATTINMRSCCCQLCEREWVCFCVYVCACECAESKRAAFCALFSVCCSRCTVVNCVLKYSQFIFLKKLS